MPECAKYEQLSVRHCIQRAPRHVVVLQFTPLLPPFRTPINVIIIVMLYCTHQCLPSMYLIKYTVGTANFRVRTVGHDDYMSLSTATPKGPARPIVPPPAGDLAALAMSFDGPSGCVHSHL